MTKWKTRVDGSPAQIGQKYQERSSAYPYGARRRASGTVVVPVERSVDSFKKPMKLTQAQKYKRIEKEFLQIVRRPSFRGRYDAVYLRLCKKYGVHPMEAHMVKPAAHSKKAKRKEGAAIEKTPEYQAGYEKGLQEAAVVKYQTHNSKSENWKKGYDAGWKKAFKDPKYDEIVLINTEEDITAWEKRRAVMESERFQMWLDERMNIPPMPSDPYQAYMIDCSLEAKLKDKPEWAKRTNRADWLPVDYPPITKQPPPDVTEPSPKTVEAEKTKELLRSRMKVLAGKMDVSEPRLRFTVSQTGRARSFYRSGFAINRYTGEIVRVSDPEIVVGIPRSGKIYPENYATLSHEMGHHKTVEDLDKNVGRDAVLHHYKAIQRSKAARIESEREAWKLADPYLQDHRPSQKWMKKWAFGTYLGTTPRKHD